MKWAKDNGYLIEEQDSLLKLEEEDHIIEEIRAQTKDSMVIIHNIKQDLLRMRLNRSIIRLVRSKGLGKDLIIYCNECKKTYNPTPIPLKDESWSNCAPKSAEGGRRILCPNGHLLIESVEWES